MGILDRGGDHLWGRDSFGGEYGHPTVTFFACDCARETRFSQVSLRTY